MLGPADVRSFGTRSSETASHGHDSAVRMGLALVCAVSELALTACSSAGTGGHGAGSCVQTISNEGKKYFDLGRLAKKKIETTRAGIGAWVYCDDNDGNGESSDGYSTGGNVSVLAVKGVDPGLQSPPSTAIGTLSCSSSADARIRPKFATALGNVSLQVV